MPPRFLWLHAPSAQPAQACAESAQARPGSVGAGADHSHVQPKSAEARSKSFQAHDKSYHPQPEPYRQVRNRKVNEALIRGVETARAVLETTPQGQAADAQFVRWLMDHQKEAGVFTTVSALVDTLSDNPAAKLTAQEIAERVRRAQQERPVAA